MHLKKLSILAIGITAVAITLAGCAAPEAKPSEENAPTGDAVASETAMAETLAFIDAGLPDLDGAEIAYITECATENTFCQVRYQGAQDAAAEMNAKLTLFNAAFDVNTQQSQVQDAVLRGFDAYVYAPVADAPGCANLEVLLETGAPVATINSPMCGNPGYTEDTAGFVAMQTELFFYQHAMNAFATCKEECEAIAVGGFVGSDLYTRWQNAIDRAAKDNPKVTVVTEQPGSFDPAAALGVVQDALQANPNAELVLSSWDDMTRGVEEAIRAAGKTPGKDVRIYSVGGTEYGTERVDTGAWNSTSVLLPYEESYYGVIQAARALTTDEKTVGFTYLAESPRITDGPKTIFITSENASGFNPEY